MRFLWLTIPDEQIKRGHTNPPLPYNCFTKSLPGISKTAFAFIESVQPYHSGAGPHNALRIIAQLSSIDRHRYLTPILLRVTVHRYVKFASGIESVSTVGGLKYGAELEPFAIDIVEPDKPVDVKRSFSPYITFEELAVGGGPATLEIENVLEVCLEQVKGIIVPAFVHLLKHRRTRLFVLTLGYSRKSVRLLTWRSVGGLHHRYERIAA
jgi:hypothetical protein